MNSLLSLVLVAVAAYLVGSLSFAVIVSRVMGLNDPRTYGSKNPGATNVLRSGSKAAAVATLLLDAVKGWLPVAAVQWWGQPYGLGEGAMAVAGLAAFLGHLFPVYFRFAGGKGVATALVYSPVSNFGIVALFAWREGGFRRSALRQLGTREYFMQQYLPVLIAMWCVWIPGVLAIYFMPTALQFPVASLVLVFWILIFKFVRKG